MKHSYEVYIVSANFPQDDQNPFSVEVVAAKDNILSMSNPSQGHVRYTRTCVTKKAEITSKGERKKSNEK